MALWDAACSTYCPLRNPFDHGSVVHLSLVTQLSHQCLLDLQWFSCCIGMDGLSCRRLKADFIFPSRMLQDGTEAQTNPIVSSVILHLSVRVNAYGLRRSDWKTHTVMSK